MAAPINVPLNVQAQNTRQLTQQIQSALNAVRLNFGGGSKALNSLSQPLGRLTGQADEFSKSLDAANARVLAFGASVGIVNAFSNAFKSLVASTIEVEKAIKAITVVGDQFNGKTKQLSQGLFNVAKATGQSFAEVSKAALEFSRQGLGVEETLQRTQDALILTRLTGLDAAKSVEGLTAAVNGFSKAGLTTTQILNKLAAVDQAFAVSSADLIEGFNRSAAVAENAGVTFDELAGIITSLQQQTSRGGAVIGNALKTIFTRLQDTSTLNQLRNLGIAVQDLEGNLLPARQILQNLATDVEGLGQITRAGIFKDVAGTFQINQLISLVSDLGKQNSIAATATQKAAGATNEAFIANEKLNQSLDAILNKVATTGKQLGSLLGEIGLSDSLKGILDGISSFLDGATKLLQGDDLGSRFAKGIVKGIGAVLTGPGLGIFLAVIAKLTLDLVRFGTQSVKTFFGIGKAARDQQLVQESIVQTLLRNQSVLSKILNTQGGQNAQAQAFLGILNQQENALQKIRTLAGGIAAPLIGAGYGVGSEGGLQRRGRRAAGGYLPAQEAADIRRGVGGASPNSKVVAIPNFAFGGGKRGTMIANTSEYIVPNYAGGGSAIFNQDMVKTMGLPPGAKKINASGGFIPNFAKEVKDVSDRYALITNDTLTGPRTIFANPKDDPNVSYKVNRYGILPTANLKGKVPKRFEDSRFTNEQLLEKYKKAAIKEASAYSLAIGGRGLGPYEISQLSNPGVVAGLVGAIFESGISGVIQGEGLRKAQAEQASNARFDFVNQKDINKFFGISESVPYIEAKYTASPDALKSFGNKIYALESGAITMQKKIPEGDKELIKVRWLNYKNRINKKTGFDEFNSIASSLGINPSIGDKASIGKKIEKALGYASNGYIPNYATSALQEAIIREKSAGLSSSQIYIDQSSALKSPSNPMGLMVANTRDEPAGGFQGIARARREGANPKLYGAAKGFVPNFFSFTPSSSQYRGGQVTSSQPQIQNNPQQTKQTKAIQDSIGSLISLQIASTALTGILSEAGETAQKFGTAIGGTLIGLQSIKELSKTEGGFAFSNLKNFKSSKAVREISSGSRYLIGARGFSTQAIGKGLGLVAKGFLRFAPLIGQVVLGFDILNGVLKAFGFDAVKYFTDAFRGVNDAGQKAKQSIENFAEILNQEGGKISGEKTAQLFRERLNKIIEDQKLEASGLPIATEEQRKASTVKLLNDEARAIYKTLTGTSLTESISQAGMSEARSGGRGFGTRNVQALDKTTIASLEAGFVEVFAPFQNLADEDIKVLAKAKGIVGENVSELRDGVLRLVINDLNKTRDVVIQGSVQDGKLTKDASQLTEEVRKFSTRSLYKNYLDALDASEKEIKAFEGRLEQNVEAVLQSEQQFFNRINRELANAVDLFSSVTSTKTFSSLGIGEQTNFLNALDIGKSQQNFIKGLTDFRAQAANTLLGEFRQRGLTSGLNQEQQGKIEDFILSFDPSNVKAFNEELNDFVARLGGVNKEGFNKLQETANGLSEQQADLISKRTNEIKLLEFSINERTTETRAIQDFNKKVLTWNKAIADSEDSIQNYNSQLRKLSQQTDFDLSISDSFALSSDEALFKRQQIELKSAQKEADIKASIAKEEARLELQKNIFTKENIIALNRNTDVLKELLEIQSIAVEDSLTEELKNLNNEIQVARVSGNESQADMLELRVDQITNVLKAISKNRAASSTVFTGPNGRNQFDGEPLKELPDIEKLISGFDKYLTDNNLKGDYQAGAEGFAQTLNLPEEQALFIRDQLIAYSRKLETEGKTRGQVIAELLESQKLEKAKNNLLSTYAATLSAQVKQGQDALRNPSTMGEFAAQQNANKLAMEALRISERGIENPQALRQNNPEEYRRLTEQNNPAVREFLSSGRYGFSEGLSEIEKQTLDFRKELGQEIPRLFSQNLAQGLNDAITGAKSLKEALSDAATSFFQAITQKNIENIANLFTFGGGKTAQGIISGFASGGMIKGGSGVKDDVPAMLMGGEYVLKKSAVNKYGSSFLDALNNGKIKGFANGGGVQSGSGGFYVPGEYGTGGIRGKRNLLTFATQSFTSGQNDVAGGFGIGGASVSLEPESVRLSQIGRQNNPMFERVQETKAQSFDLFLQQLKQESQYRDQLKQMEEAQKQREKQLITSIVSAVASSVVSVAGSAFSTGAKNAVAQAGTQTGQSLTTASKIGTGFIGGAKNLAALFPGGAKATFELNDAAKAIASMKQVGFNKTSLPDYSSGTFTSGSYEYDPFKGFGRVGRAAGGMVYGGSGMRDDVPAMLTGGEFVLNNRATRKLGMQNLNRLNAGEIGAEDRSGAITESLLGKLDELIQATRETSSENVVVNVNASETSAAAEKNVQGTEKELQRKIRQAVLDVIAQEKRLGGSLNKNN